MMVADGRIKHCDYGTWGECPLCARDPFAPDRNEPYHRKAEYHRIQAGAERRREHIEKYGYWYFKHRTFFFG